MVDIVVNGETTFLDMNGDPLAAGQVFFYLPGTTTLTNTYQDAAGTIVNTNPVVLDQAGRAVIWAPLGQIRQVVEDQFGNVQWDRVAAAGITSQNITITGLTVNGNGTITGTFTASGPAVFNGASTFNEGVTSNGGLQVNGHLGVNGFTDTQGIVVSPTGIDAIQANGDIIVQDGSGGGGNTVLITSSVTPAFSLVNTAGTAIGWGMWNASEDLQWGTVDAAGRPITSEMSLDSSGVLGLGSLNASGSATVGGSLTVGTFATIDGGLTVDNGFTLAGGQATFSGTVFLEGGLGAAPSGGSPVDMGTASNPFNNMYAHAFNVVSTDASSALLGDGQLGLVQRVPVKTLPHVGIAEADAKAGGLGVVEGGGMNYNTVIGVLWKALQELKSEFDTYVAAHP